MTDFVIPCETYARLCKVHHCEPLEPHEFDNTIRLEDNVAISSNRKIMVIEKLPIPNKGIIHIKTDEVLAEQCEEAAKTKGFLTINYQPAMKYAIASLTTGYNHTENLAVTSEESNPWGDWRDLIADASAVENKGSMFWSMAEMIALNAASPTGSLIFPTHINADYPVLVRDVNSPDWLGLFMPSSTNRDYQPASVPEWIK